MILWLLIAVGAVVLVKEWPSAEPFSATAAPVRSASGVGTPKLAHWTDPIDLWGINLFLKSGAPAPQPAPGEITVPPTLAPTLAESQGETLDKVPVNKSEPLKVWYTL